MMNENDEDNDDNTLKTAQVQSLVCPIGLRDFSQRLGQIQQPLPFLPAEFGYKTPHLHGTGISTIQHSPNTNLTSEPATLMNQHSHPKNQPHNDCRNLLFDGRLRRTFHGIMIAQSFGLLEAIRESPRQPKRIVIISSQMICPLSQLNCFRTRQEWASACQFSSTPTGFSGSHSWASYARIWSNMSDLFKSWNLLNTYLNQNTFHLRFSTSKLLFLSWTLLRVEGQMAHCSALTSQRTWCGWQKLILQTIGNTSEKQESLIAYVKASERGQLLI